MKRSDCLWNRDWITFYSEWMVYSGKEEPFRLVSKIWTVYDSNILDTKYHHLQKVLYVKIFYNLFRKYDNIKSISIESYSKECTISTKLLVCSRLPFDLRKRGLTSRFPSYAKTVFLVTWILPGDFYLCTLFTRTSWKKPWMNEWMNEWPLLLFIILGNHLYSTATASCYFFNPWEESLLEKNLV